MDIKVDAQTVVCFDLDDTLYNEIDFLESGYKAIAEILDPTDSFLLPKMLELHHTGADCFEFLEQKFRARRRNLTALYRYHQPEISPFEGVSELFTKILQMNARIAVITDGRSMTQRNKLSSLGLIDRLDALIISEEIGSEKPDIRNFEAIQAQIPARQYYYFGDNYLKDFISPNQLGWTTVGLQDNGKNIHKTQNLDLEPNYFPQLKVEFISEIRII